MEGGTQNEGVLEQDADENIWTKESWSNRRVNNGNLHNLYSFPSIIGIIKSRRM
jgi:hypothetical protein